MEANQSDGHPTRIRTGLPEFTGAGSTSTPPSKSQRAEPGQGRLRTLEAIMELDVEELRLTAAATGPLHERRHFAECAFTCVRKVAATLLRQQQLNPDEFNGLAMRYPAQGRQQRAGRRRTRRHRTSLWLVAWARSPCMESTLRQHRADSLSRGSQNLHDSGSGRPQIPGGGR